MQILINKLSYVINSFSDKQIKELNKKQYATISDNFVQELNLKNYQDGFIEDDDGQLLPNVISYLTLHYISKINYEKIENERFDKVISIEFNTTENVVYNYLKLKTNLEFKNRKYHIEIANLEKFNNSEYRTFATYCMLHPNIDVSTSLLSKNSIDAKGDIYLDNIKGDENNPIEEGDINHFMMIKYVVYPDNLEQVFKLNINQYK